eukprot:jgi/Chrzof1/3203/Cz12g15210.t1
MADSFDMVGHCKSVRRYMTEQLGVLVQDMAAAQEMRGRRWVAYCRYQPSDSFWSLRAMAVYCGGLTGVYVVIR